MQVKIIGWKPGAQKVSCTKLLQESAGMRLADAHATTVAATEGRQPIVAVHSEDVAYELVDALDNLGFMAQLINVGTSVPREEAIRIASVHLAEIELGHPDYRLVSDLLGQDRSGRWVFSYRVECLKDIPPESQERWGGAGGFMVAADGGVQVLAWPAFQEKRRRLENAI